MFCEWTGHFGDPGLPTITFLFQDWESLWCACEASYNENLAFSKATEQMQLQQENSLNQGVIYICTILCLYVTGVIVILVRSGHYFGSCIDFISGFLTFLVHFVRRK